MHGHPFTQRFTFEVTDKYIIHVRANFQLAILDTKMTCSGRASLEEKIGKNYMVSFSSSKWGYGRFNIQNSSTFYVWVTGLIVGLVVWSIWGIIL